MSTSGEAGVPRACPAEAVGCSGGQSEGGRIGPGIKLFSLLMPRVWSLGSWCTGGAIEAGAA